MPFDIRPIGFMNNIWGFAPYKKQTNKTTQPTTSGSKPQFGPPKPNGQQRTTNPFLTFNRWANSVNHRPTTGGGTVSPQNQMGPPRPNGQQQTTNPFLQFGQWANTANHKPTTAATGSGTVSPQNQAGTTNQTTQIVPVAGTTTTIAGVDINSPVTWNNTSSGEPKGYTVIGDADHPVGDLSVEQSKLENWLAQGYQLGADGTLLNKDGTPAIGFDGTGTKYDPMLLARWGLVPSGQTPPTTDAGQMVVGALGIPGTQVPYTTTPFDYTSHADNRPTNPFWLWNADNNEDSDSFANLSSLPITIEDAKRAYNSMLLKSFMNHSQENFDRIFPYFAMAMMDIPPEELPSDEVPLGEEAGEEIVSPITSSRWQRNLAAEAGPTTLSGKFMYQEEAMQATRYSGYQGGGNVNGLGSSEGLDAEFTPVGESSPTAYTTFKTLSTSNAKSIIKELNNTADAITSAFTKGTYQSGPEVEAFVTLEYYDTAAALKMINGGAIKNMPNEGVYTRLIFEAADGGIIVVDSAGTHVLEG